MSTSTQDRVTEDGHLQTALSGGHLQNNDMARAVDELLDLITVKFSKISTEVFAKSEQASAVDEMAQRLDELEASIKAGADTND